MGQNFEKTPGVIGGPPLRLLLEIVVVRLGLI
jgi:hypothetical protein